MIARGFIGFSAIAICAATSVPPVPYWSAPVGDRTKPLGGWPVVPGAAWVPIYNSSTAPEEYGTYNHAAMVTFGAELSDQSPLFLVTWKNGCPGCGEDQPGQKIAYSQSLDGDVWTSTGVMFPNISTTSNPAALFAEPPLWLNGRLYAAASPKQFCLYADQYSDVLLLRRVYTNSTGALGTLFWATSPAPPAFAEASALQGVLDLSQMDETTQADVALLTQTATHFPCGLPGAVTSKCDACPGGCQLWSDAKNVSNERTHYTLPGGNEYNDVLLYRGHDSDSRLWASMRTSPGQGSWSPPVPTNISNDWSNLNAGTLPDGRLYLLSNPLPMDARDPLVIATSKDGLDWGTAAVAMSCTLLPTGNGSQCYTGRNHGPSYPQGLVVPSMEALFVVATNSKKDVWIARLPLDAL